MYLSTLQLMLALCILKGAALIACSASAQNLQVLALQNALNKKSCHVGIADGYWGSQTEKGLNLFTEQTGIKINRPITNFEVALVTDNKSVCPLNLPKRETKFSGFELDIDNSVRAPRRLSSGEQLFELFPGQCKDGPKYTSDATSLGVLTNDCDRRRQRSEMAMTRFAREGDQLIYLWEIFVPRDFESNATNDHLIVGQIHNGRGPTSTFSLSNEAGYFINGHNCFGPEEFGSWQSIAVRVRWSSKPKRTLRDITPGIFEVWCNNERIWSLSGRPNIRPGDRHNFKYGLYHAKDFPESDNVTVRFRNVRVIRW